MAISRLTNTVRAYSWGGTSAIAELLGVADDGEPKAELWMGAHPDSPSRLPDGRGLDEAIVDDAQALLGSPVETAFGKRLPYLLKILSAAVPLSLQVHPDKDQAAAGYEDEETRGVARDAADRRYRDPFHKPEMLLALEPFDALCGLRDRGDTLALLSSFDVAHPAWSHLLALLSETDDSSALRGVVGWLLGGDDRLPSLVRAVGRCAAATAGGPELRTVAALAESYPEDPGVLVALLLNRVTLARGEALFLPAGNLHAYLHGTGVEIMASSDNVLRAGLTSKYVDADEVVRVTDFTPHALPFVVPRREGPIAMYRPEVAEFELAFIQLPSSAAQTWHRIPLTGPRILLVLEGELELIVGATVERMERGTAVFVPAADGEMSLRGEGAAVAAGVPPA